MTEFVPAPLDPDPGTPVRSISLEELRRSVRPMTVLQRVEACAMGNTPMTVVELKAAELFLRKTQPDLKSLEVAMTKPLETLDDAELTGVLELVRRLIAAEQARGGTAATPKSATAH